MGILFKSLRKKNWNTYVSKPMGYVHTSTQLEQKKKKKKSPDGIRTGATDPDGNLWRLDGCPQDEAPGLLDVLLSDGQRALERLTALVHTLGVQDLPERGDISCNGSYAMSLHVTARSGRCGATLAGITVNMCPDSRVNSVTEVTRCVPANATSFT